MLGWLRGRGIANPFLTAAVWVLAEATSRAFHSAGSRGARSGYAFHNIEIGRALASDGGVELVTFFAVALNGFLADAIVDAVEARARSPARPWAWLGAGLAVVIVVPLVATGVRSAPHPDRHDAGRGPAGQRQEPRPDRRRGRRRATCPTATSQLAARVQGPGRPGDLSRVEHGRRSAHRSVPAPPSRRRSPAATHAWVLANAVADAPAHGIEPAGAKALNLNVLFATRRHGRGDLREAPPRAVRRVRAVPLLARSRCIHALDQIPRDFEAGHRPGLFDGRRSQGRDDHLLRVRVRLPGAAARARGRAGDHRLDQQPLLRAIRELRPTRRDRADARGRDRTAASCRPRSRASPRSSTPTGSCTSGPSSSIAPCSRRPSPRPADETPYVRYGEWVIWMSRIVLAAAVLLSIRRVGLRPRSRERTAGFVDSPRQPSVGGSHRRSNGR